MLNAPNFFVCNNLQLARQFANVCKGQAFMPFHRMKSELFYFVSSANNCNFALDKFLNDGF